MDILLDGENRVATAPKRAVPKAFEFKNILQPIKECLFVPTCTIPPRGGHPPTEGGFHPSRVASLLGVAGGFTALNSVAG